MESAASARSRHARRLFAGIALSYEWVATVLSLGQDPRWRRALAAAVCAKNEDRVLDVATGTGMVARALVRRYGCRVIGLDQTFTYLLRYVDDPAATLRGSGPHSVGHTARFVLDHASCPVLLVRGSQIN